MEWWECMISTDFCVASKDEKCVISWFHPSCWIVFLYTFREKAAAVNQRPQMFLKSVRKKSQGAVQSAEFSCQSTLQTHHKKHSEVHLALRCCCCWDG